MGEANMMINVNNVKTKLLQYIFLVLTILFRIYILYEMFVNIIYLLNVVK